MNLFFLLLLFFSKGNGEEHECSSNICLNGGTCLADQTTRTYHCVCAQNFIGKLCQEECSLDCIHGQCSQSSFGDHFCSCQQGWRGKLCDIFETEETCNVDEDCSNGQRCFSTTNGRLCLSDPCGSDICKNNATCSFNEEELVCSCSEGYSGRFCEKDVDECALSPCGNGGTCVNLQGSFECLCPSEHQGRLCEDGISSSTCTVDLCENGGSCQDLGNGTFNCICREGFQGKTCNMQDPSSACSSSPCKNGAECIELLDTYQCVCSPDWTGPQCEQKVDCLVEGKQCANGGSCVRGIGRTYCLCSSDYDGVHCETLELRPPPNPCDLKPCLNNGVCSVANGSVSCECIPPYIGDFCSRKDFCYENPCQNQGKCALTADGFQCDCDENYTGDLCDKKKITRGNEISSVVKATSIEKDSHEINSQANTIQLSQLAEDCERCGPVDSCINDPQGSFCICREGFRGTLCEKNGNICDKSTCKSPEICRTLITKTQESWWCGCPVGFRGPLCQESSSYSLLHNSLFIHHSNNLFIGSSSGSIPYSLQLSFKTTVPFAHIVSTENIFGATLFSIAIDQGFLTMNLTGNYYSPLIPMTVNDGNWFSLNITKTDADLDISLSTSRGFVVLSRPFPRSQSFEVFTTRIGLLADGQNFIGCLADIVLEGNHIDIASDPKAKMITHGCQRTEQCEVDRCKNGGTCVDLWTDSQCVCKPPFLPPLCDKVTDPATFGNKNSSSIFQIRIPQEVSKAFRTKTITQFLVRTNKEDGQIMFLGESGTDELSTFESIEVLHGKILARARLGGRSMLELSSHGRIDDNIEHLVRVQRTGKHMKLFVDEVEESSGDVISRLEHPLFVEKLLIGRADKTPHDAFTTTTHFKGSLQDLRMNDVSIPFDDDVTSTGVVESKDNVLRGSVSDDVCAHISCGPGICHNTFNDFDCACEQGFFGRLCEQKDFCLSSPCPEGVLCQNVKGGFFCIGSASFVQSSYLIFEPSKNEKIPIGEISFAFRTHSQHAQILQIRSTSTTFSISLAYGQLVLGSSPRNFTIRKLVSDGTWVQVLMKNHIIDINGTKYGLPPFISVPDLLSSGSLTLGSLDGQTFQGCMETVRIGSLPMISFYNEKTFSPPSDVLYWKNIKRNKVSQGCLSSDSCGAANLCIRGECEDIWNKAKCICPPGFTGDRCETNIDECGSTRCENGYCIDGIGDARCECYTGFSGTDCSVCNHPPCDDLTNGLSDSLTDPCRSHKCHSGTCVLEDGNTTCECEPGYTGDHCSIVLDLCSSNSCSNRGRCNAVWNATFCNCQKGFTGLSCSADIDECLEIPCENDGDCVNEPGGFSCRCPKYYMGELCEIEGSCLASPCVHGECLQHSATNHSCKCHRGFEGNNCQEQIDFCKSSPCMNGGTCEKLIGEFKCHCIKGFSGVRCETDIDECALGYCKNNAKCRDRVGDYECLCNDTGYTGRNCTEDIDECEVASNCVNGACTNTKGAYFCNCDEGYIGSKCALGDLCLPDSSNNTRHSCVHGKCVNPSVKIENGHETATHECECDRGYGGPTCTSPVEVMRSVSLAHVIAPLATVLVVLCVLACLLFFFVWRGKRALHGHYSPQGHEVYGARIQMNTVMKLPPEERLI